MGYKVVTDELNVLQSLGEFKDLNDNFAGYNHRSNLYFRDEIIPDEKVSPVIKEALDGKDENNKIYRHLQGRLVKVNANGEEFDVAKRIGLPFPDYDSLSEDDVVETLRVLPSATGQVIKEWESQQENPRTRILEFNLGLREGVDDRLRGEAGSRLQDAAVKNTAEIQTRSVDGSDVVLGEGDTGSQPDRPRGSGRTTPVEGATAEVEASAPEVEVEEPAEDDDDSKDKSGGGGSTAKAKKN